VKLQTYPAVSYVDFGDNYAFDDASEFSVEFKVIVPTGASASATILVNKTENYDDGWLVYGFTGVDDLAFQTAGPNFVDTLTWPHPEDIDPTLSRDVAHHVVAVRKSDRTMQLFVDGRLVASKVPTGALVTTTAPLTLGDEGGYSSPVPLDELAIYDYALSPERILAHYNAGIA
jgi:hypothetical protein